MCAKRATETDADVVRAWLNDVMQRTGLRATPLAKRVGLAPSTLLRALDANRPTALERRSIVLIAAATGLPAPSIGGEAAGGQIGPRGFAEPDLVPLSEQPPVWNGRTLTPNQYVATVGSRVLVLAGVMPGDELLMDMAARPEAGDIIQAQVYGAADADTLLRLYDPPYLVTRSADDPPKPLPVDGERVRIAAVARGVWRDMASRQK